MSFILGPFTDFQKCRILIFISYEFYHWQGTVLYLLKTRLRNIKGYEKRKLAPPKSEKDVCSSDLGEKEVEELHAELLREVMRKKINLAAIKELRENTFHSRRCSIQELKAPEKNIVDEIVAKFPFFKEHDCVVSEILRHVISLLYILFQVSGPKRKLLRQTGIIVSMCHIAK